jgi:hypothetical protein
MRWALAIGSRSICFRPDIDDVRPSFSATPDRERSMNNRDRLHNAIKSSAEAMVYPEHKDLELLAIRLSSLYPQSGETLSQITRELNEAVDAHAEREGMHFG